MYQTNMYEGTLAETVAIPSTNGMAPVIHATLKGGHYDSQQGDFPCTSRRQRY